MLSMSAIKLANKRVMIREDLNVPMKEGVITSDERIIRALPTIQQALKQNAAVMVLSHLGRPDEGSYNQAFSLAPIAHALSEALGQEVLLKRDWLNGIDIKPGQIVLCENVRFNVGEKENDEVLARRMAALCDVFVMDAFATAHRAEASTVGVAEYAKEACAGPLLMEELSALKKALHHAERPLIAIVGGSKVSTKIQLLDHLLDKVDVLIPGGGIANTLLAAKGYSVGKSLYEADWIEASQAFFKKAAAKGVSIALPSDVAIAKQFEATAKREHRALTDIESDDLILDVGPETIAHYAPLMRTAKTIVWNGPVGVFEFPEFALGTRALGDAIVNSSAYSLAGGGDTVAAIQAFGMRDKISYVSTGGGAFLEFLQGDVLPAVSVLEKRVSL